MPTFPTVASARRPAPRRRPAVLALAGGVTLATLALAAPVHAASVQNIDPPSGLAMIEDNITLRWQLDVSGCDSGKTAVTTIEVEADGAVVVADGTLPEPAAAGLNAGLFAAAAADGFRFTFRAVALKLDGSPSLYRWRARLLCTGPGIPPDPVEQIDVRSNWSEFRVSRLSATPGTQPTGPGAGPGAAPMVPKPQIGRPIGPTRARIKSFLGWAPRNRPLLSPFTASQIPRPLTPSGATIASCARGPRGLLAVFRYAGIARKRAINWTWTRDGRRLSAGGGVIGGQNLYQLWIGYRNRPLENGVYTVSIRLGKSFLGAASVRRAC